MTTTDFLIPLTQTVEQAAHPDSKVSTRLFLILVHRHILTKVINQHMKICTEEFNQLPVTQIYADEYDQLDLKDR